MKFWMKTRGAVSIFLVIILVPMLTVASLFVDASKVKLAQGVAESAGDLALNTALTDYDTMLKDMYGLFATAQDTEELYAKLEDYYRTCITSSGVSAEDAQTYVDQIMAQLSLVGEGDQTADILNMQLVDFSAEKRADATLANATILQKQIVEFMKYRAPVNTGLSFLSALQSFNTLSKQTELVEKRQNYYEEQQTVMEHAQQAWTYISRYNQSGFVQSVDYFTQMAEDFGSYEKAYQDLAAEIIKNLYDTQNYDGFSPYMYSIVEEVVEVEKDDFRTVPFFYTDANKEYWRLAYHEYATYSEEELASASDVRGALVAYYNAYNKLKTAEQALLEYDSGTYGLQYLVQTNRQDLYENWVQAMVTLYDKYSLLRHTVTYSGYDASGVSVMTTTEAMCGKDTAQAYSAYYQEFTNDFDIVATQFNQQLPQYNSTLQSYANQVNNKRLTDSSGEEGAIAVLYGQVNGYRKTVYMAKLNLENAVTHLNAVYAAVKDDGTLAKKEGEWSALADDSELDNTSMAKQDRAELDSLKDFRQPEEVKKLIDRLNNIITHLGQMLDQIDSYTFFDCPIVEINDYAALMRLLKADIGDQALKSVPLNEAQLDAQSETWRSGKFVIGQKVDVSWENQQGTQARLAGANTDKLDFYTYLYAHFSTSTLAQTGEPTNDTTVKEENESNGKKLYEDIKTSSTATADDKLKESEGENITTTTELSELDNRPSKNGGNGSSVPSAKKITGDTPAKDDTPGTKVTGETAKSLSSMFGSLSSKVADMGTDLRDNLYVADYVLSMFSYDTIEKEFKKTHEDGTELKLQTLTKMPIDADHNFAYGKEVEYIIYGGSNTGNLAKAYASIYGIRLGFNLIYAFSDPAIRDMAFAVAAPISAATLGVIPAPLIQAAIILGIACCESAWDLVDLRNGESIPLFKSKETFRCSVNGLMSEARQEVGEALKDLSSEFIGYGEEKLNELLDMTDEQLTAYLDKNAEELQTTVTEAYDELIARHANAAIQQLITLCNNAIEQYLVDPSVQMEQVVNNGLDNWLAQQAVGVDTSSDLGYIIKAEAVKLIKQQFVGEMLGVLTAGADYAQTTVTSAANAMTDVVDEIRTKLTDTISKGCDAVKEYKGKMMNSLSDAASKGAGELKKALNEQLDGVFSGGVGAAPNASDPTGLASLLTFSYSDYLRLFLLIGLYTDQEGVLLRTADVIQANMAHMTGEEGYLLSNSAAYVTVSATVQVQPLLMALPLFADVQNNPINNQNWYTFDYSAIRGY